jgi:hypothetical protein
MLNLDKVTGVFINGNESSKTLHHSTTTEQFTYLIKNLQNKINFFEIVYFTSGKSIDLPKVNNVVIDTLSSYTSFNNFCLRVVPYFIKSEFALYMQGDGFPLNPHLWTDEFYEYDYIGAPWPAYWLKEEYVFDKNLDGHNKGGNGGFSLRSKKFLQLSSQLPYFENFNEDEYVCFIKENWLTENGIKFSNIEIGKKFSHESDWPNHHNDLNQVFGFHNRSKIKEAQEIFKRNFVLNESL